MMKNFKSKSHAQSAKRQELEVSLPLVLAIAATIFIAVYALLIPIRESTIAILLYDRGFTQYLVVFLAAMVIAISVLKLVILQPEYQALNKIWLAEHIPLDRPESGEVHLLHERLNASRSLVAKRCGRVVGAYINSGDRSGAAEFALDDSSFYQSASESSYSVPRIFVWAIPLLGFIGTVVGISQAVNQFSGVLSTAGDVDQIKDGIGGVTNGLAVAFDTTLLALLLSVLVMIPLVLVERYESRLLLGIDIFINDKLLPRLKEKNQGISPEIINRAVKNAVDEYLPDPQILIEPAHNYAQQAASSLAQGFLQEISQVQNISSQIIAQVTEVRAIAESDRQNMVDFIAQQQTLNQKTITQIQDLVTEIQQKNTYLTNDLSNQAQQVTIQLEKAAQVLERRIASLEASANTISDLKRWQNSLDENLRSLEKTAQLTQVLEGVKNNLSQLKPVLTKLNQPRKITLIEQDDNQ